MQQQLPNSKAEAIVAVNSLIEAFAESLTRGKASQVLEYDTAIGLAIELGATRATVKMISKMPEKVAFGGLVSLYGIWIVKYNAIHGED